MTRPSPAPLDPQASGAPQQDPGGQHDLGPEQADRTRQAPPPRRLAEGVLEIDTLLGGWQEATAGYLLTGQRPVLIETGSQTSVPVLLEALARLGLGPSDLAGIAVTHIHLDHAGGVGDVAAAFPRATVYVHEKGARHLVDPSRLVASAGRVYGDLLDSLYGRLEPTPEDRVRVLGDGEAIELGGGRRVIAVDSPGHAKHHLGFHDELSGLLFSGDGVGVRLPAGGVLRPATPPPDFDLDLAVRSLRRFGERQPAGIALTHYGLVPLPVDELLEEAEATLMAWAEEAERAWRAGEDIAGALQARFAHDYDGLPAGVRDRVEAMNGFHSNADGLRRFFEQREKGAATDRS